MSPLQEAAPALHIAGSSSEETEIAKREAVTKAMRAEELAYALSYADPVGEEAIREAAAKVRIALGWEPKTQFKIVAGSSKKPTHISDDLADVVFRFLALVADIEPTHSGKGNRASFKKPKPTTKNGPVADQIAKPGSYETNTKKKNH